jgi:NitT/TauT family transport system substrate-binding protein
VLHRRVLGTVGAALLGTALVAGCAGGADDGQRGGAAGGSPGAGQAQAVTILRAPAFTQFPLFVAEAQGFYAKHGLAPDFVSVQSGPEGTAAQLSGRLHISDQVLNNMLPVVEKGADLVAFAKSMPASQFDILIKSDVPLPRQADGWQGIMKDLEGKRVGVIARGAGAEDIARTLFQEAGADPNAATYIATGLPPTTIAAMEGNTIDMAITLEPGIALAVKSGLAKTPFSIRAGDGPTLLQWPGVVATTTRTYAQENPGVLQKYVATINETLKFIKDPANKATVVGLLQSRLSVPADVSEYLYTENLNNFPDTVDLTDQDIQALDRAGAWVKSIGKTTKEFKGSDIVVRAGQ